MFSLRYDLVKFYHAEEKAVEGDDDHLGHEEHVLLGQDGHEDEDGAEHDDAVEEDQVVDVAGPRRGGN